MSDDPMDAKLPAHELRFKWAFENEQRALDALRDALAAGEPRERLEYLLGDCYKMLANLVSEAAIYRDAIKGLR